MKLNQESTRAPLFLLTVFAVMVLSGCGADLTDVEYLERARDYQDKGDLTASVIELKNALRVKLDNVEARWLLGKTYLKMDFAASAEKELRKAQELGVGREAIILPLARSLLLQRKYQEVLDESQDLEGLSREDKAELVALQGHAYRGLEDTEKADSAYEKALSINPDNAESFIGKAFLALMQLNLQVTKEWLEKALESDPGFALAWSLSGDLARHEGDAEQAETAYGKAIANDEWNLNYSFKRALARINMEKYNDAADDIRAVRSGGKLRAGADYAQGLIYLQQGKNREAQGAFEKVLVINPKYMPAVFYVGVTHYIQGHNKQAHSYLSQYVASAPNSKPAHQLLAVLELREKNYEEARRRLAPVLQRWPDDLLTLRLMTNVAVAQGNTAEAVEYMNKVAEAGPDSDQTHIGLGLALLVEGETESGALALQKSIELDEDFKLAEFALILSYLQQGKPDVALASATEFTDRYPDSPMGWTLLGLVQLKNDQIEAATSSFEHALEIVPGEPGASNNLAVLALKNGDIDEAIRLYESVLEHRPGHMPSVVSLAKLMKRRGRWTDVEALLEKKVEEYPQALEPRVMLSEDYVKQGQSGKAVTVLQDVKEKFSGYPIYLRALGNAQLASGDVTGAVYTLKRLAELQPRSITAQYRLAEAYHKAENLDKAGVTLKQALTINPGHLPSLVMMLDVLIKQNRLDTAAKLLKGLEEQYPNYSRLAELRARLAMVQNRPEEAIKNYQEAMKVAPGSELVGKLALAQWRAGQQAAGIQTMKDWLAAHPEDLVVRYNLANLYLAANRHEEARQAFSLVVVERPNHVVALTNLALLSREPDAGKAFEYAKRAYELAPDAPMVKDAMALVQLDRGEVSQAVNLLERAVEKAPNDLKIRYHLALALARQGETEQARLKLERILGEGKPFAGEDDARALLKKLSTKPG